MASSFVQPSASDIMQDCVINLLSSKILKPLDEALRCHICFEYFTNCMITKCSHNYCSVCIRRYMNYKTQCPTCFQVATEPELQNNRLIDEILRIYKKIRESLQIPCDTLNKSLPEQSTSSKSVVSDASEKPVHPEISTQSASNQQNDVSVSDEVSCPVCYTTIPNSRINIHLDSCLKQSEERSQRKFLPKLVYHLLSDKEIKKKLKEHGLSTSGNRQALIRRHKNFIILYNANCDSLNPKPVSDLLLEIERQELEEKLNTHERNMQVNKKSDPSIIEKEHELYVQEHKSQFNALIQDVQQRVLVESHIKKEFDTTNEEPVIVKEEPPETVLEDTYVKYNDEQTVTVNKASDPEEPDTDFNRTSQLPFRIKKDLPTMKIKDEPQFLLDKTNQDFTTDSPSSLDDFEISKTPINRFQKKKYARRLSIEDKSSQRKK